MPKVEPTIQRIAELQQLVADFSKVKRVLELADNGQLENDVEHSYGLALTCWFLVPKIAPKLDIKKVLYYALAHDLVEIHSGDTYVFDKEGVRSKEARETTALQQLKKDWGDFPELIEAMEGYKEKRDAEAKFVYTVDKMLPPILINLGEKEQFWIKNRVTREMHETEKQSKMRHSPEALPYLEALNEWLADPDYFYKPEA